MFIISIFYLILSISVTLRRDVSIIISRTAIIILICCIFLISNTTNLILIAKNLGIFSGLFQISPIIEIFKAFIYIITSIILLLTSYYPRKLLEIDSKRYIDNMIITSEEIKNREDAINKKKKFFQFLMYWI